MFNKSLSGEVADLGAGWGYLSVEALRLNERIKKITLFENNYSAHLASKKNINDRRASFKWASLENLRNVTPSFNHIICNPPFHSGNLKDINLLKSFIFYSSRLIKHSGSVWMVFVSGLSLEHNFKEHFGDIKILYRDKHYYVCRLLKPKNQGY